jgi:hypothetical protein
MANNYVIGRGRLYFDRFDAAGESTGFRYLGNTPSISVTKDSQTLDHYDSDSGLKVKDKSVTLQEDVRLSFETDNISPENLALWFAGSTGAGATTAAATDATHAVDDVVVGVSYYVGRENISGVAVAPAGGGTAVDASKYVVDAAGGMITFTGDDLAGDDLVVTYDAEAVTSTGTIIDSGSTVFGALRYVSDNPVGANQVMNYPYVKLTPNGDYQLKGDEWQKLSFNVEILRDSTLGVRFAIDQRAATNA